MFLQVNRFFKNLEYEAEEISRNEDGFPNKIKLFKKGIVHYLYFETIPNKLTTVRNNSGKLNLISQLNWRMVNS